MPPDDQWEVVADPKVIDDFGTELITMGAIGYRRYEVFGHGSSHDKTGWWWVVRFDTTFDENVLMREYVRYWYKVTTRHTIYLEVLDSGGGYRETGK